MSIALLFTSCEDDNDSEPKDGKGYPTYSISEVKTGAFPEGDTIEVEGTFVHPGPIRADAQRFIVDSGNRNMRPRMTAGRKPLNMMITGTEKPPQILPQREKTAPLVVT